MSPVRPLIWPLRPSREVGAGVAGAVGVASGPVGGQGQRAKGATSHPRQLSLDRPMTHNRPIVLDSELGF